MSNSMRLHDEAMNAAEMAVLARVNKDYEAASRLFRQSLELELSALATIEPGPHSEPSYSILHRSAATLALDCNDHRLAEKLVGKALASDPPAEIAEELRDLMEQIHFRRHLHLRGITLAEDELQMSLAGQGVGFGVVHSSEFLQRVEDASKIFYRIVERRQSRPFREKGRLKQYIKDDYELFLSVPRAASFAVTLKLGRPTKQQMLPGLADTADIVNEFMELIALVNKADFPAITKRIPDEAYRTNFVQLAKRLAPDGKNVSIVGFTALRGGQESFVEVTRPRAKIVPSEIVPTVSIHVEDAIRVCGILRFADATHPEGGQIKIVEEGTKVTHLVRVPQGMMNDIVKPLWDSAVVITGKREGKFILLEDIQEQEDSQE